MTIYEAKRRFDGPFTLRWAQPGLWNLRLFLELDNYVLRSGVSVRETLRELLPSYREVHRNFARFFVADHNPSSRLDTYLDDRSPRDIGISGFTELVCALNTTLSRLNLDGYETTTGETATNPNARFTAVGILSGWNQGDSIASFPLGGVIARIDHAILEEIVNPDGTNTLERMITTALQQTCCWKPVEDAGKWKEDVLRELSLCLDEHINQRTLRARESSDLVEVKNKYADCHMRWFVRYQIGGETFNEIRKSDKIENKNGVVQGIKSIATLLEMPLRKADQGGRPRTSKMRV